MELMITYKEVCNEKIERGAMIALIADVIVTVVEGVFVPNMLIYEVVILHLLIAMSALLTLARCLAGPFAYRRIEYIKNLRDNFAQARRPSIGEAWSERANFSIELKSYE
jgi:hypothetical protein